MVVECRAYSSLADEKPSHVEIYEGDEPSVREAITRWAECHPAPEAIEIEDLTADSRQTTRERER
jgi:hypothetical protein